MAPAAIMLAQTYCAYYSELPQETEWVVVAHFTCVSLWTFPEVVVESAVRSNFYAIKHCQCDRKR